MSPDPRSAVAPEMPLRNRNIGVLCDDPQSDEAIQLQQAAAALGARVALVRCDLDDTSSAVEMAHTARILDRLYDAVLCLNLAPSTVQSLRAAAQISVMAQACPDSAGEPAGSPGSAERTRAGLLAQLAAL